MHPYHEVILKEIRKRSGKPTAHTFSDGYLGTSHPRHPIDAPTMHEIAREWMGQHRDMGAGEFSLLLTSLVKGESATEKCMAGVLLGASRAEQRKFDPNLFDTWLNHLVGWAEIDTLCTGKYAMTEVPSQWTTWKKLLSGWSRSANINKRRASLVMLCSPLRSAPDARLTASAFDSISRLKGEKEVIITKAISWVLRSAAKHHSKEVKKYITLNKATLPKIAVRETLTLLKTGTKTKPKRKAL